VRDILAALGADRQIDVRLTTRHTRARRQVRTGLAPSGPLGGSVDDLVVGDRVAAQAEPEERL
jgi:hypothetical protein